MQSQAQLSCFFDVKTFAVPFFCCFFAGFCYHNFKLKCISETANVAHSVRMFLLHYIDIQCVFATIVTASLVFLFTGTLFVIQASGTRQRCQFNELHSIKVVKQQENKCKSFFNHNIKTIFLLIFEEFSNVFAHFHAILILHCLVNMCRMSMWEEKFMSTPHSHPQAGWNKNRNEGCSRPRVYFHQSLVLSFILLEIETARRANIIACNHCISRDREREWWKKNNLQGKHDAKVQWITFWNEIKTLRWITHETESALCSLFFSRKMR